MGALVILERAVAFGVRAGTFDRALDRLVQDVGPEQPAGRRDQGALDDVLQLADVARPGVRTEDREHGLRDLTRRAAMMAAA